jgi:branched-chain amino acid aminotransferase
MQTLASETPAPAAPAPHRPFAATENHVSASEVGLAELRRISRTARVFVSMPFVEGVTPRVLRDPDRSRAHPTSEPLERREGCFAVDEIGLPVLDHGVLYGDAAFEGVLAAHGRLFTWREHLARLHQSCERLGISVPYDGVDLTRRLLDAVRETGVGPHERGYVRLVVTRGLGDLGVSPTRCVGSTVYAVCARIQLYPEEAYQRGIGLSVARRVRRPMADTLDPQVKSCNYLNNIRALLETLSEKSLETMMLTPDGFVAEATADNLFLVIREAGWETDPRRVRVVTPSPEYCLNGITRALLMRAARDAGYRVEESATMLPGDWAGPEREGFLTGTGAGVMPVTSVAGVPVGDGTAGPVTHALRQRFLAYMADPALSVSLDATDDEIETYLSR